jgi:hypothetical protein
MDRRTIWLASGFAAGLLLTGIPYWRLPYNADFFADPGILLGLGGLGLVTAVLAFAGIAPAGRLFLVMIGAFPGAVALRVAVETAQDPTSHNLWPFELIIMAVFSLIAVVPGLLVGVLLRRLKMT